MSWCMRCGKWTGSGGGWCNPCHKFVILEYRTRRAIKPGGKSCVSRDEKPSRVTAKPIGVDWGAVWLIINFMRRRIHVRGSGYYALDDTHPWQEVAQRAWEEADAGVQE